MSILRRLVPWTVLLAGCLCPTGCGSGGEEQVGAPGAPIQVPTISAGGRPLSEAQPELVQRVKEECGGGVCVNLVVRHRTSMQDDYCGLERLDPAPGQEIARGETIYMDTGSQNKRPCGVPESVPADPAFVSPGTGVEQSPATSPDSPPPTETGPSPVDTGPGSPGDEEDQVPTPDEQPDEQPDQQPDEPPEQQPEEQAT